MSRRTSQFGIASDVERVEEISIGLQGGWPKGGKYETV